MPETLQQLHAKKGYAQRVWEGGVKDGLKDMGFGALYTGGGLGFDLLFDTRANPATGVAEGWVAKAIERNTTIGGNPAGIGNPVPGKIYGGVEAISDWGYNKAAGAAARHFGIDVPKLPEPVGLGLSVLSNVRSDMSFGGHSMKNIWMINPASVTGAWMVGRGAVKVGSTLFNEMVKPGSTFSAN